VLRPLGFALPEPLRRPADPNSPGRIANPYDNRSVIGKFLLKLRQIPVLFRDVVQARGCLGNTCARVPATILARSASEGSGYPRSRFGLVCRVRYPQLNQARFQPLSSPAKQAVEVPSACLIFGRDVRFSSAAGLRPGRKPRFDALRQRRPGGR